MSAIAITILCVVGLFENQWLWYYNVQEVEFIRIKYSLCCCIWRYLLYCMVWDKSTQFFSVQEHFLLLACVVFLLGISLLHFESSELLHVHRLLPPPSPRYMYILAYVCFFCFNSYNIWSIFRKIYVNFEALQDILKPYCMDFLQL